MRITIKNGDRSFDIAGHSGEVLDTIRVLTSVIEDIADVTATAEPQEFMAYVADLFLVEALDILAEPAPKMHVSWSAPSDPEAFDTHGYKVGDRVVMLEDQSDELKAGEVLFVRKIDDGAFGWPLEVARRPNAEFSDADYFVLNFEEVEPLVFRKGDTVIITGADTWNSKNYLGRSGIITPSAALFGFDWPEGPDEDGDYRVADPHNLNICLGYFRVENLKLYRRAPEVVPAPEVTAPALPALVIPGEHVRAFLDWAGSRTGAQDREAGVDPDASYKLWDALDDHVGTYGDVDFPLDNAEQALVVTGQLGTEEAGSTHSKAYMPLYDALEARGIYTYAERYEAKNGRRPLLGAGPQA